MQTTETQRHRETEMLMHESLTREIIGAAREVHRELGPGLLESAYQTCLCEELRLRRIKFLMNFHVPVLKDGIVRRVL